MMKSKMNKKLWIPALLLIGLLGTSCSALNSAADNLNKLLPGGTNVVGQAATTEDVAQAQEVTQTDTAPDQTQAVEATPAQPVVVADSSLTAYQDALTQIYEGVSPSVVSITAVGNQGAGQGSGFVWDSEGHIVTNHHVIDGAQDVTVEFQDGTIVNADIVGSDVYSDLAVLKVDVSADFLQPVQMADSDQIKVGQLAIAIGNPYALENTMTVGIVSAIGRSIAAGNPNFSGSSYSIPDIIQTDAPINPGNSGGVLVNNTGQVIGVTNAIESATGANAGIGFAIPANIVKMVVPGLIENGSYDHPYLGISGTALYPDLATQMNLDPEQRGALVVEVTPDSPADQAGLKGSQSQVTVNGEQVLSGGDVITAIEGQPVQSMDDLISYLYSRTQVDQTITLTVLRDGKETDVEVTLAARPPMEAGQMPIVQQPMSEGAFLGVTGIDMTPEIATAMELSEDQTGVLIQQIEKGSPAEDFGLQAGTEEVNLNGQTVLIGGDIIVQFNDVEINGIMDLAEGIYSARPGDQVTLSVLRDGETIQLEGSLGGS